METAHSAVPHYDPSCYLCPGNTRAEGKSNPEYSSTFVFDNDFAALTAGASDSVADQNAHTLLRAEPETGICRVVCYSPRHDLTLAQMSPEAIRGVIDTWREEYRTLGSAKDVRYVQIFENRGAAMGCSNAHPHGQIWASSSIPNEPAREELSLTEYHSERGVCLLCDYLNAEKSAGERIVCANEHFTALVPYWAVWPFEVLLLAHRHFGCMTELSAEEQLALADILKRVTTRYDNLFEVSFPYSMGFHQSPTDGQPHPGQHFHAHFYPPLLRSATVRKFMVGYEMLATPQRDITAEDAAARLRALSELHYTLR
jgi:UDPglucose--hexose-1-phosphate uridylyltransferase